MQHTNAQHNTEYKMRITEKQSANNRIAQQHITEKQSTNMTAKHVATQYTTSTHTSKAYNRTESHIYIT